ncbi:hypothetical protein G5714_013489 [Onychostoma macrolepis]|uniref:Uncharacterized protein n=1 Tax=Onychostoma macrolepis TaxID=369639 RepID=A0A7J6CES8_9TELE|nr:hypothetical protein G5714_013489 [Onychostoma macrolepis]
MGFSGLSSPWAVLSICVSLSRSPQKRPTQTNDIIRLRLQLREEKLSAGGEDAGLISSRGIFCRPNTCHHRLDSALCCSEEEDNQGVYSNPLGRGNIMLTDVLCRWDSLDGGSCQARDDNIKARESDDKCLLSANEASDKSNCGSQEPPLHPAARSFSLTRGSAVWSECSCIPLFQDLWLEDGDADCTAGDGERCLTASSRIQTGTDGSRDANPASDETS